MVAWPFSITLNFGLHTIHYYYYYYSQANLKTQTFASSHICNQSTVPQDMRNQASLAKLLRYSWQMSSSNQCQLNLSWKLWQFSGFFFRTVNSCFKTFSVSNKFSDCFSICDDLPLFYSQAHIIINPVPYLLCLWNSQYNTIRAPFYSRQLKYTQYFIINNTNLKAPQKL